MIVWMCNNCSERTAEDVASARFHDFCISFQNCVIAVGHSLRVPSNSAITTSTYGTAVNVVAENYVDPTVVVPVNTTTCTLTTTTNTSNSSIATSTCVAPDCDGTQQKVIQTVDVNNPDAVGDSLIVPSNFATTTSTYGTAVVDGTQQKVTQTVDVNEKLIYILLHEGFAKYSTQHPMPDLTETSKDQNALRHQYLNGFLYYMIQEQRLTKNKHGRKNVTRVDGILGLVNFKNNCHVNAWLHLLERALSPIHHHLWKRMPDDFRKMLEMLKSKGPVSKAEIKPALEQFTKMLTDTYPSMLTHAAKGKQACLLDTARATVELESFQEKLPHLFNFSTSYFLTCPKCNVVQGTDPEKGLILHVSTQSQETAAQERAGLQDTFIAEGVEVVDLPSCLNICQVVVHDSDYKFKCNSCDQTTMSTDDNPLRSTSLICQLPEYLLVHTRRSESVEDTKRAGQVGSVNRRGIIAPLRLPLERLISKEHYNDALSATLVGCAHHSGNDGSGHWTSVIEHDGKYYNCNDEHVNITSIDQECVVGTQTGTVFMYAVDKTLKVMFIHLDKHSEAYYDQDHYDSQSTDAEWIQEYLRKCLGDDTYYEYFPSDTGQLDKDEDLDADNIKKCPNNIQAAAFFLRKTFGVEITMVTWEDFVEDCKCEEDQAAFRDYCVIFDCVSEQIGAFYPAMYKKFIDCLDSLEHVNLHPCRELRNFIHTRVPYMEEFKESVLPTTPCTNDNEVKEALSMNTGPYFYKTVLSCQALNTGKVESYDDQEQIEKINKLLRERSVVLIQPYNAVINQGQYYFFTNREEIMCITHSKVDKANDLFVVTEVPITENTHDTVNIETGKIQAQAICKRLMCLFPKSPPLYRIDMFYHNNQWWINEITIGSPIAYLFPNNTSFPIVEMSAITLFYWMQGIECPEFEWVEHSRCSWFKCCRKKGESLPKTGCKRKR